MSIPRSYDRNCLIDDRLSRPTPHRVPSTTTAEFSVRTDRAFPQGSKVDIPPDLGHCITAKKPPLIQWLH